MFTLPYGLLQQYGFSHPLHPTLTHLPIGLVLGAFCFLLISMLFRISSLRQTASHCLVLAAITLPLAAGLGVLDWLYFYSGTWLFAIKMKVGLAAALFIFLIVAIVSELRKGSPGRLSGLWYLICVGLVIGLGFFGGELVYGPSPARVVPQHVSASVDQGAAFFQERCAMCHYTDSPDTRVGPSLQGLFAKETMPVSGWEMTETTIKKQLQTPYAKMPSFEEVTEEQFAALIAYLKTL